MIDGRDMKTPTVSILIPTYNYARYLPEAIESILAQDFSDFELIIADDASSDNTVEICEAYANRDARIRFFRHEKNLGLVENFNWCLRQACGKYIKYMLADDKFAKPYALRMLVEAIERRSNISLVTSARSLMNEASNITGVWNPLGPKPLLFSGKKLIRKCLTRNINLIGEPTAVLFKKQDASRGFDKEYRQLVDLEMWIHLLLIGDLIYLPDSLCCFRQHSEQQTAKNKISNLHEFEYLKICFQHAKIIPKYFNFKRIYRMRKKGLESDSTFKHYNTTINKSEYITFLIWYRLTRPFYKLKKWIVKPLKRKASGLKINT